jgi:hypothetical protein
MSDELKKDEQAPEVKTEVSGESLPESELEKAAGGGKVKLSEFVITKPVGMSSP